MSHTYVILQVSPAVYEEIRAKLLAADYVDQFHGVLGSVEEVIDMHGIALQAGPDED